MQDNRTERVKTICADNVNNGCRKVCPLATPCNTQPGDTKTIFDERMNKAAEELDAMRNPITGWSWEKPTQDGIYLACRGDVETIENIQPFKLVQSGAEHHGQHPWPTYDREFVASWDKSFKFAKLCVGAEAGE